MNKSLLLSLILVISFIFLLGCTNLPVCGNNVCEMLESHTTCPADCETTQTHFECQNQQCIKVLGNGFDKCTIDSECSTNFCGDGLCKGNENDETCPEDCANPVECGDNICGPDEDIYNCPQDCRTTPYCGDNICNNNETETSCPQDCNNPQDLCGNGLIDSGENCEADADCKDTQMCNQLCICQTQVTEECNNETDNGINSAKKGQAAFTNWNNENYIVNLVGEPDSCIDENTLREATCSYSWETQSSVVKYVNIKCPNGCNDGKCTVPEGLEFCIPGDETDCIPIDENTYCRKRSYSSSVFVQGLTYLSSFENMWNAEKELKSECVDERTIIQFGCEPFTTHYADQFSLPFYNELNCPDNYSCNGGKCVEKNNNPTDRSEGIYRYGDLTRDGNYNSADLDAMELLILSSTSTYDPIADFDGDGLVDIYDKYLMEKELSNEIFSVGQEYPYRSFWLNATKSLLGSDEKVGILKEKSMLNLSWEECLSPEHSGLCLITTWEDEYKQVGASRSQCIPPVLKNNLKNVNSRTRILGLVGTNRYDEFRMVPDCDIWYQHEADNVIRENFIYWLFRKYQVPTYKTIAFGETKLTSTDSSIKPDTNYHYLFIQTPKGQHDTVPFEIEHNFSDLLDDDELWSRQGSYEWSEWNDMLGITIIYPDHNELMEFDPENAIRYKLLTEFTNLQDRGAFHNEMYGKNINNNYWKQIPYDFDLSFDCSMSSPNMDYALDSIPEERRQEYKDIYYSVAREIFSDINNLNEMLFEIDSYPFNANKTKMKGFIKTKFYIYALYFSSEQFAQNMNNPYSPFTNTNIINREARRILNTLNFDILCADQLPQNTLYNFIN